MQTAPQPLQPENTASIICGIIRHALTNAGLELTASTFLPDTEAGDTVFDVRLADGETTHLIRVESCTIGPFK